MNTEKMRAIRFYRQSFAVDYLVLINLNMIFYILNFKEGKGTILKNEAKAGPSNLLPGITCLDP